MTDLKQHNGKTKLFLPKSAKSDMKALKKIKDILIELQITGRLPADISQINEFEFVQALMPFLFSLRILRADAEKALAGTWGEMDKGFRHQIDLIDMVLNEFL